MQDSTSIPGNPSFGGPADAGGVRGTVESAGAGLHSGIDKVADPLHNTVNRASAAAHETVDKFASGAAQVADAPGRAIDCSKSWVQDKPLEAVGLALALGFIIGRLTAH